MHRSAASLIILLACLACDKPLLDEPKVIRRQQLPETKFEILLAEFGCGATTPTYYHVLIKNPSDDLNIDKYAVFTISNVYDETAINWSIKGNVVTISYPRTGEVGYRETQKVGSITVAFHPYGKSS